MAYLWVWRRSGEEAPHLLQHLHDRPSSNWRELRWHRNSLWTSTTRCWFHQESRLVDLSMSASSWAMPNNLDGCINIIIVDQSIHSTLAEKFGSCVHRASPTPCRFQLQAPLGTAAPQEFWSLLTSSFTHSGHVSVPDAGQHAPATSWHPLLRYHVWICGWPGLFLEPLQTRHAFSRLRSTTDAHSQGHSNTHSV